MKRTHYQCLAALAAALTLVSASAQSVTLAASPPGAHHDHDRWGRGVFDPQQRREHRPAGMQRGLDARRERWHQGSTDGHRGGVSTRGTTTTSIARTAATITPSAQSSATIAPVAATVSTPNTPVLTTATGSVSLLLTTGARAAGIDPSLVKAIAWQESGWRMVTSADGGIGIMQLMPGTVTWVQNALLGQTINPYNAADNIRAGIALLRYDINQLGNQRLAIAAYHQGLQSVRTQGVSAATAAYVSSVLALQQQYAR